MSNPQSLVTCNVLLPVANCDHNSISTHVNLPLRSRYPKQSSKRVWIYKAANIELGQRLLKDLPLASSFDDIDEYWAKWSQVFMSVMHHCIPCKTVPIKCKTPWINQEIRSSIRKRWSLFHRFKHTKCYDCLVKYRSLRNSIVNWIRKAKKEFFVKLANSRSNLKAFWATIRKLQPRNSSPSVLSNGSATATSDLDKANLF